MIEWIFYKLSFFVVFIWIIECEISVFIKVIFFNQKPVIIIFINAESSVAVVFLFGWNSSVIGSELLVFLSEFCFFDNIPFFIAFFYIIQSSLRERIINLMLCNRVCFRDIIYVSLSVIGFISEKKFIFIIKTFCKNYLSKKEGEVILSSFILPSFPFIYGVIIPKLNL